MAEFPHCNTDVIHEPGVCAYCDRFPHLQEARKASGRQFSNVVQAWPGNSPDGYGDWYFPEPMQYVPKWDIELERRKDGMIFWSIWNPSGKLVRSGWAKSVYKARLASVAWTMFYSLSKRRKHDA